MQWTKKDEEQYKNLSKKRVDFIKGLLDPNILNTTPIDELTDSTVNTLKNNAPRKLSGNVVVLPKDEAHVTNLSGAEPYIYKVKSGDTLKKISELFSISYGELSNYVLSKEGTTTIYVGQELHIPRHFVDLTHA